MLSHTQAGKARLQLRLMMPAISVIGGKAQVGFGQTKLSGK
jgi:hypothetical protein